MKMIELKKKIKQKYNQPFSQRCIEKQKQYCSNNATQKKEEMKNEFKKKKIK